MERTVKFSDKGKGQASSKSNAPDVVKRAAKHGEQSHRGNNTQADQKSISDKEHTSNPKASTIKPQKYRTSRLRERNFEPRWSSQKHRNAGQERRRLLGGGDGEESSQNQELARKLEEQAEWRKAADAYWDMREEEHRAKLREKWTKAAEEGRIMTEENHQRIIKSDTSFKWDLGQTETGIYGQGRKNDKEAEQLPLNFERLKL